MPYLRSVLLVLAAHCLSLRAVLSQSSACYFPDHTDAANFTACDASATESSCCRDSEACLSNGYCLQQTGHANRITRGACTDPTFSNAACPSLCTDGGTSTVVTTTSESLTWVIVAKDNSMSFYLAKDTVPNGVFCCFPRYNITSGQCITSAGGPSEPFEIPAGTIIVDRSSGATLTINSTTGTNTTTTTTVTAVSVRDSNMTAVAAGVAVPLGVCLAAALAGCACLFHLLRKERRIRAVSDTSSLAVPL
ncbi:hypothetical protein DOTSEDRAFT_80027 [Dothistroma septosporum NZE10]|uniref:Mid2 domain-containing protein n=1 Tax=Dothistroma septosporum (strain NZE10 / CBS 128990) TaxID=675120 RepID=N1PL31_DOTSN|nr:hypothetical protein DOTSEDRAFT_80027 [Dothistroma septosporum NZE10]